MIHIRTRTVSLFLLPKACTSSRIEKFNYSFHSLGSPALAGCSQLALGLGIPLTFLLTAIISSLLTFLITYLCLIRSRSHKYTPPVQEPVLTGPAPVYEPVSATSGEVEMKTNVAYGHVTTGGNVTYETVAQ